MRLAEEGITFSEAREVNRTDWGTAAVWKRSMIERFGACTWSGVESSRPRKAGNVGGRAMAVG